MCQTHLTGYTWYSTAHEFFKCSNSITFKFPKNANLFPWFQTPNELVMTLNTGTVTIWHGISQHGTADLCFITDKTCNSLTVNQESFQMLALTTFLGNIKRFCRARN
jgi:hypothetical protein